MKKSYNTDIAKEVKEQRKILPYTVTPIADLAVWKTEQAQKQAKWDAGRSERYAAAKERSVSVIQSFRPSKDSLADRAYRAYTSEPVRSAKTSADNDTKSQVTQQISLVSRIRDWCLNTFLDISY